MEECGGDVQWRACVRLFETVFVFVVESWNIAVNLDGTPLFEAQRSVFLLVPFTFPTKIRFYKNRKPPFVFASMLSRAPKANQKEGNNKRELGVFEGSYDECSYDTPVTHVPFVQ